MLHGSQVLLLGQAAQPSPLFWCVDVDSASKGGQVLTTSLDGWLGEPAH